MVSLEFIDKRTLVHLTTDIYYLYLVSVILFYFRTYKILSILGNYSEAIALQKYYDNKNNSLTSPIKTNIMILVILVLDFVLIKYRKNKK